MKFRPCIDLHQGKVKQVVGSSFSDQLITNFVATQPPQWYATQYHKDQLSGGHVIMLGPSNTSAAKATLSAWPDGLQLGGGMNETNAKEWLDHGAQAIIVTSALFRKGEADLDQLQRIKKAIGRNRLVIDLSCRYRDGDYYVVTNLWTQYTQVKIEPKQLDFFAKHSFEFLIHGVDVEGKGLGIDRPLLKILGDWGNHPMTYAGGVRSHEDIAAIKQAGNGTIDFSVGSALDLFGGTGLKYDHLVQANRRGF